MSNNKNIIQSGTRFGKLTVLSLTDLRRDHARVYLCECDCGTVMHAVGKLLRRGAVKSCGCLVDKTESNRRSVFRSYKARAKKYGRAFTLSREHFYELLSGDCFYCGTGPSNRSTYYDADKPFEYNGVDRIDSSKGYEDGNVVPCCKRCNFMKSDMSTDEFLTRVKTIYENKF